MFETIIDFLSSIWAAFTGFITSLFNSVTSTIITIVVLICMTVLLVTIIKTYQNSHTVEHHIIDTDAKEEVIIEKQKKQDAKV